MHLRSFNCTIVEKNNNNNKCAVFVWLRWQRKITLNSIPHAAAIISSKTHVRSRQLLAVAPVASKPTDRRKGSRHFDVLPIYFCYGRRFDANNNNGETNGNNCFKCVCVLFLFLLSFATNKGNEQLAVVQHGCLCLVLSMFFGQSILDRVECDTGRVHVRNEKLWNGRIGIRVVLTFSAAKRLRASTIVHETWVMSTWPIPPRISFCCYNAANQK